MLSIFKTVDGRVTEVNDISAGCWVNMVAPTNEEINIVAESAGLDKGFLLAALDEEETSRVEVEDDGQTLIIIDVPYAEKEAALTYTTMPMGIVLNEEIVVTVTLKEVGAISEICDGRVKNIHTGLKTRFIFQLLLRVANRFLQYLRQIDKISNYVERSLYKSQRNKELIQLLDLEKSLVYFSTSLKSNEVTLEKVARGRIIKLYEEDQDLLDDVLVEFRQAIQMTDIYASILTGTMDAFASVISNNLNVIMKVLTSITILITIPNIVFSYYGMNVSGLPIAQAWFPAALSVGIIVVVGIILGKKGFF